MNASKTFLQLEETFFYFYLSSRYIFCFFLCGMNFASNYIVENNVKEKKNMITNVSVENIVELRVKHQYLEAYPLMKHLHSDLNQEEYLELLDQRLRDGYKFIALYHDTNIVAFACIIWRDDAYNQSYVFIKELLTDIHQRPSGLGYRLLRYINKWAMGSGASYISLDSWISR